MPQALEPATLRIGELGRRVGLSEHVLRAWERRYGLLQPARSQGGYRLYTQADEDRIRRMQGHLAHGVSAAEAAQAALREEPVLGTGAVAGSNGALAEADGAVAGGGGAVAGAGGNGLAQAAGSLARSLDHFDEPGAQTALDRLFAQYTVETVLRDVLLPYLRQLGERWSEGTVSVGAEHFGSNLLRARLAGLTTGWGRGAGPRAVLACPPGEQHDLPLLMFGIVLRRGGWRVEYLGADTPLLEIQHAAAGLNADLAVVAAAMRRRLRGLSAALAEVAGVVPLALAGAGATAAGARAAGARLLTGDPVTEAELLAGGRG